MNHNDLTWGQLFAVLRRRVLWMVLAALIAGGGAFALCRFCVAPVYTASGTLYVAVREAETSSAVTAARKLAESYSLILESDAVLEQVADRLDSACTWEALTRAVTVRQAGETELITVSADTPDPVLSMEIVNTLLEVGPETAEQVVQAGELRVVDRARLPTRPSAPGTGRNTVLAAAVGLVVSGLIAVTVPERKREKVNN